MGTDGFDEKVTESPHRVEFFGLGDLEATVEDIQSLNAEAAMIKIRSEWHPNKAMDHRL
jgi:hypothetical protein